MNDLRAEIASIRPPVAADYLPIVKGLRPFAPDEELNLRATLMLYRDRAMSTKGASTTCAPSWGILDVVEKVASECAMNEGLKIEQLRELRKLCVECVRTAAGFDTLFQPRLPLEDGEGK